MNNGQVNQHGNFQSRSSLFWAFYQTIVSRLLFIRFISHSISPLHWGALACPNKEIYAGHQLPAGWRFHRRHARLKTVAQPLLCCSLIFLGSKAAATRILEFQWIRKLLLLLIKYLSFNKSHCRPFFVGQVISLPLWNLICLPLAPKQRMVNFEDFLDNNVPMQDSILDNLIISLDTEVNSTNCYAGSGVTETFIEHLPEEVLQKVKRATQFPNLCGNTQVFSKLPLKDLANAAATCCQVSHFVQ